MSVERCGAVARAKDGTPLWIFGDRPFVGVLADEVDMVNHPPHYRSSSGLEVIDVIKAFTEGLVGIEAVYTANVIKYICRWKKKNGAEDLRKAAWYASKLADEIESAEDQTIIEKKYLGEEPSVIQGAASTPPTPDFCLNSDRHKGPGVAGGPGVHK